MSKFFLIRLIIILQGIINFLRLYLISMLFQILHKILTIWISFFKIHDLLNIFFKLRSITPIFFNQIFLLFILNKFLWTRINFFQFFFLPFIKSKNFMKFIKNFFLIRKNRIFKNIFRLRQIQQSLNSKKLLSLTIP